MLKPYLTFAWISLAFMATSCASLTAFLGGQPKDEEAELALRDPVAAMAMKLRKERMPASALASPEAQEADELRLSMARSSRDIASGMSMNEVRALWGEPREIERAGDSSAGNERWTYYEGLSSRWSMSAARRVYFEHGAVAGWERLNP